MSRFANLNLNFDAPVSAPIAPAAPVVARPATRPAPVAPAALAVPGQTIVAAAKAMADREQQVARDVLGLSVTESKQLYANGTMLAASGVAAALAFHQEYEARAMAKDALQSLKAKIESEQRRDDIVEVKDLRIDDRGVLVGGKANLAISENAFSQLINGYRGTAGEHLPTVLRGNFNLWAGKSDKTVRLRTRNPQPDGTRTAFAAVSRKYEVFDIHQVAAELIKLIPADARATWMYEGTRAQIDICLAPTHKVNELGVGRVHRVHLLVGTGDDGKTAAEVEFAIERARCINFTRIRDERVMFHQRHMGKKFVAMFRTALSKANVALEIFGEMWRDANKSAMVDKHDGSPLSAEETFRRLIAHEYVHVPHVSNADTLARLLDAYGKEPGPGAAHINMAITRMAHESAKDWQSPWVVQDLERQAGDLLFQKVYVLPRMTEEQKASF